jgi:hypothetical protein
MTTIIKTNTITTPNNMAVLDMVQLLADAAIVAIPSVKAWWRPDYGLTGTGNGTQSSGPDIQWIDMVSGIALTAMSDTGPRLIASAHNAQPCLRFNSSGRNGRLYDAEGNDLWPASASVTLAFVAKMTSGTYETFIGTDRSSAYAVLDHSSSDSLRAGHQVTPFFTHAGVGTTDPFIAIYSYDFSDHSYELRINGASAKTGTAGSEVLAGNLSVGQGGTNQQPFRNDFYELLVFEDPLHAEDNAAYLGALEGYLAARYGL